MSPLVEYSSILYFTLGTGLSEEFLKDYLVSFTCDKAAVILGSCVAALIKEEFPVIIIWLCASHRLKSQSMMRGRYTGAVNRFKVLLYKLYAKYHALPKKAREFSVFTSFPESQLLINW